MLYRYPSTYPCMYPSMYGRCLTLILLSSPRLLSRAPINTCRGPVLSDWASRPWTIAKPMPLLAPETRAILLLTDMMTLWYYECQWFVPHRVSNECVIYDEWCSLSDTCSYLQWGGGGDRGDLGQTNSVYRYLQYRRRKENNRTHVLRSNVVNTKGGVARSTADEGKGERKMDRDSHIFIKTWLSKVEFWSCRFTRDVKLTSGVRTTKKKIDENNPPPQIKMKDGISGCSTSIFKI